MDGATLIARERFRQLVGEGYSAEHDNDHAQGELVDAAIAYAQFTPNTMRAALVRWPWAREQFKPDAEDPLPNLVRAGALIAAEIDRLRRFRAASK